MKVNRFCLFFFFFVDHFKYSFVASTKPSICLTLTQIVPPWLDCHGQAHYCDHQLMIIFVKYTTAPLQIWSVYTILSPSLFIPPTPPLSFPFFFPPSVKKVAMPTQKLVTDFFSSRVDANSSIEEGTAASHSPASGDDGGINSQVSAHQMKRRRAAKS